MEFIYRKENALSLNLCNEIIELYECDETKYDGLTFGGVQKNIKNTTDLIVPQNEKWIKIEECLYKELHKNISN